MKLKARWSRKLSTYTACTATQPLHKGYKNIGLKQIYLAVTNKHCRSRAKLCLQFILFEIPARNYFFHILIIVVLNSRIH